jgi:hypothetical protein
MGKIEQRANLLTAQPDRLKFRRAQTSHIACSGERVVETGRIGPRAGQDREPIEQFETNLQR